MTRLRWGSAKVEFIAVQLELQRLLTAGHSKKMAFEKLSEAGWISMSYTRFCELCKGNKKNRPSAKQRSPVAHNALADSGQENAPARSGPRVVGVKRHKFGELDTGYDPLGLDKENQ